MKSKDKGTRAETKVVRYLESKGIQARRKALEGCNDKGDVEIFNAPQLVEPISLEVKAGKQTSNPNRSQVMEWLRQAKVEGSNSNQPVFLVVVRYNRKLCDADVWKVINGIRVHMYLDEFADSLI